MKKGVYNVTLSTERWYVTADKMRAVRGDDPAAAFLLVGKGGAIAPEVAAHYGIETYQGEAVERVAENPEHERSRMVSEGTSGTDKNYEEMRVNREVRESVNNNLTTEGNRSAGRQGEMMAASIVQARKLEAPESQTAFPAEPPEPVTRTVDIPPPGSASVSPPKDSEGPDNEPDAEVKDPSGQAGEHPLEGDLELDDIKNKTL